MFKIEKSGQKRGNRAHANHKRKFSHLARFHWRNDCWKNFASKHPHAGKEGFRPAKIILGIIEKLDTESKKVHFKRESDGRPDFIEYDDVIIGMGTRQNTEAFPGLSEHGYKLKEWDHCFQLRNHIPRMFELASSTHDENERQAMLTFFIAGGGFSGTEVAGELGILAKKLTKRDYPEIKPEEVRVILVHPGKTILPEFYGPRVQTNQVKEYPKLVRYAEKQLRKTGVELMTNTRINAVSPNSVTLDNGMVIPTRTVISAVGTKPQGVVLKVIYLLLHPVGLIVRILAL